VMTQPFDLLTSPLDGTNLIEASAGTGKTYTIAALYLRLILEKGLTPEQILVVTFTEAATKELRDRIRRKLRDAAEAFGGAPVDDAFVLDTMSRSASPGTAQQQLTWALRDFDQAAIFTIHGFCQRTLHENAFESSSLFDTELVATQKDLKREIVEDFWRTRFYQAPPYVVRYALTHGYGPPAFYKLVAAKSTCQPDLGIIPEISPPSLDSLEGEVGQLSAVVRRLEEVWPAAREEVGRQLRSPGLKGNSIYRALEAKGKAGGESPREVRIAELFQDMENYLREKDPAFPLPLGSHLEAFTSTKLKASTKKNGAVPSNNLFDLCDEIHTLATTVETAMERYFLWLKREAYLTIDTELPKRKERRNIQHFDDLLLRLKEGLEQAGGAELARAVRKRYRAALIDEFQDTDPIQFAIFHNLFASRDDGCLFLIGDPKQAIYSFRGADIFTYMKAAAGAERTYTLGTNWRSEPDLIHAVNTVFSAEPSPGTTASLDAPSSPFVYPEITFQPVASPPERTPHPLTIDGRAQPPLQLWFLGAESAGSEGKPLTKGDAQALIRDAVAAEIVRLLRLGAAGEALIGDRPLREGDLAVLVRANHEARDLKEALSALNVPSVLHSTDDVFASPEAEELERVLRAIAEPQRESLLRAALVTDMLGARGEDLAEWMRDEALWEEWIVRFRTYSNVWNTYGFMRMFRQFLIELRVRSRLLMLPNGERRITNVLHLSEILHQESVERRLAAPELLKWLVGQREADFRATVEHQLRLESDENAVKLVTIHKSKGLEYPIVFCPFCWGSSRLPKGTSAPFTFHDESNERKLTLDLGSPERDAHRICAERELLAENMRLMYVAMTRAQKSCYLVWGRFNTAETSAPAYLFHYRGAAPGTPDADVVGATSAICKALSDTQMWEQMQSLAERAGGCIQLQPMQLADLGKAGAYARAEAARETLRERDFKGTIERHWRISSFSALTSTLAHGAELPDRDESVQPGIQPAMEEATEGEPPSVAEEAPSGIFAFPAGAKTGILLHSILEHLDFASTESGAMEDLVHQMLRDYGFDLKWHDTVCAMLRKVLTVPLGQEGQGQIDPGARGREAAEQDGNSFTLAQVVASERLNELEFYFPLETLTPERLQGVFAKWGAGPLSPVLPREWAEWLKRLNFQPVKGFMKGFIDLVFRFDGRYYLVDWKSNHLGNHVRDYCPKALATAMQREYYVLQYHLYAVALDRYLAMRLRGYDYEKHFGGVFYIFLRGVDPAAGARYGVFHDRPLQGLIRDLSAVLAGDEV